MTIALFAIESVPLQSIASSLAGEGLEVRAIELSSSRSFQSLGPEINKGVLIFPKHGSADLTDRVSRLLTKERSLILCSPQPDGEDRQLLKELGATEVITPRSWEPEHVSERILAQLILDGDVAPSACGNLLGANSAMRNLYREIAIFAPLPDPVLILGESGTGKELVASEIHNLSKRSDKFLSINCGGLSHELAGSDLFGHKKGSFTGASEARRGLLAEAGHGTVFLDEIGSLDFKVQSILLRVLEDNKVRPIGSNQTECVSARIVLATNLDLESECEKGRFRKDLFERIRGFTLELKPLRERRADIPLLALHFLTEYNKETGRNVQLPGPAFDCLCSYEWVGNVRELRAAVRNAAAFADPGCTISVLHLLRTTRRGRKQKETSESHAPDDAKYNVAFDPTKETWKTFNKRAETSYFQALMTATGGDKKEACRLSGLSSTQFYEKLKTSLK